MWSLSPLMLSLYTYFSLQSRTDETSSSDGLPQLPKEVRICSVWEINYSYITQTILRAHAGFHLVVNDNDIVHSALTQ